MSCGGTGDSGLLSVLGELTSLITNLAPFQIFGKQNLLALKFFLENKIKWPNLFESRKLEEALSLSV